MALAAAQVVDALVARLLAVTVTSGRVYPSRTWPLADADLPAWLVFVQDEPVELQGLDGDMHMHTPVIACRAHAAATADLDDTLNALAAAGLAALFAPPVPYALELTAIERRMATLGEARLGTVTLLVRATFIARASAPETILTS